MKRISRADVSRAIGVREREPDAPKPGPELAVWRAALVRSFPSLSAATADGWFDSLTRECGWTAHEMVAALPRARAAFSAKERDLFTPVSEGILDAIKTACAENRQAEQPVRRALPTPLRPDPERAARAARIAGEVYAARRDGRATWDDDEIECRRRISSKDEQP